MTWQSVQIGLMELVVAAAIGLAVVYGSYRLFDRLTPGLDEEGEIRKDNRAVAVAMGAHLVAVALIVREALYPITATIQDLALAPWSLAAAARGVGYAVLYLAIVVAAALLAVALTGRAFTRLTTGLRERQEIARGNLAAALFHGAVVIAIAIFVAQGAGSLARALIPEPPLPQGDVVHLPAPVPPAPRPAAGGGERGP